LSLRNSLKNPIAESLSNKKVTMFFLLNIVTCCCEYVLRFLLSSLP
jgi:hypothetical protein